MEPLVVIGAAAVIVCGFMTGSEVVKDLKSDGSWEAAQEYLKLLRTVALQLGHRLGRAKTRKVMYYRWT